MKAIDILLNISTEIVAALLIFLLGLLGSKIPRSIIKYKMRKFFGNSFFGDGCKIVYGNISLLRSLERDLKSSEKRKQNIFKVYHDKRIRKVPVMEKFITSEIMRSHSYLIQGFSKFRKKTFEILTDYEAIKNLDNTYICIGGPIVNEISEWALNERANNFVNFSIPEDIDNDPVRINVLTNEDKKLFFENTQGKDYGIILKIKNSRFPNDFFFVCAGISVWGTSGATWYLTKYWNKLLKEFGKKEFGLILETIIDSDTSTTRIYP